MQSFPEKTPVPPPNAVTNSFREVPVPYMAIMTPMKPTAAMPTRSIPRRAAPPVLVELPALLVAEGMVPDAELADAAE